MDKQADEGPRLVVLKLDNGELAEDVAHHGATSGQTETGHPAALSSQPGFELVESLDLPEELLNVDPTDLTQPARSRREAQQSTVASSQRPAQTIEEEI
jgi:hypothetical protein